MQNKKCPTCDTLHHGRGRYCCRKCVQMSDETKAKISKARSKFLSENPDKHPWRNSDKFKSVPCELIKAYLKSKSIVFVDEWQPIKTKGYLIDIAFPDIKLGIEINGNQHYNKDGTLKAYYQKRHDEIISTGWTLLELHYSIAYDLDSFDKLLKIPRQPDYSLFFMEKERMQAQSKIKPLPRGVRLSQKADEKWEPYKAIVVNSGIDFAKFGWVRQVAEILSIKDQKVKKWMMRYLPDLYKTCFKRKTNATVA